MRAVLSIGSNMADRYALLSTVYTDFRKERVAASQIYSTPPWGVTDQEDFLNAVLIVDVRESPLGLLHRCQALENAADRTREERWGPRTLDVDIIALDQPITSTPELTVPHPRAHQRAFVLLPWLEVEPDAQLHGQPLRQWLDQLPADEVHAITPAGSFREHP